ncbi:MAG: type IV toxin-antitoxin system AbiEi family antitoxin domain-containing protein [Lachnospiraceae bacterium]|nr:type IV toxin-antitoxin system AbiEi family antitoxin domain-containing protein [Lachnospiraceae bacterium]
MTQYEKIRELLKNQNGMIQTTQVLDADISKRIFYLYVRENKLEQIAHGIYVAEDTWVDSMYVLHLRCEQAIFSHDTALFFHDLTDREPLQYSVTVKTGYNPSRLKQDGVQVYTIKKDLHEVGMIKKKTSFGHEVPVYNMERTICDLIRSRNKIEIQTLQDALKQYAKRKDKNLRILMQYADLFHVEKILRQYLEVLL